MDPAAAISNAQEVVAQANLPADLQPTAFAEVLRYLLAGGADGPAQAASPGTAGWSRVTNTETATPDGAPSTGTASTGTAPSTGPVVGTGPITPAVPGLPADPVQDTPSPQPASWSRVENKAEPQDPGSTPVEPPPGG